MARDTEGVAEVLDAIAGEDEKDSTCHAEPDDYTEVIKNADSTLKGTTIAVPDELVGEGLEEGVRERFEETLKTARDEGAEVREVSMPSLDKALAAYYVIAMGEASSNLARYDGVRYGPGGEGKDWNESFADARGRFGEEVKRRVMLGTYALSEGYYGRYYKKAQNVRALVRQDFEDVLNEAGVVASPTMPLTPFKIGEALDDPLRMYLADANTTPVNLAGVPSVSLPCGRSGDLPVGLQLTAGRFEEAKLLQTARGFEKSV